MEGVREVEEVDRVVVEVQVAVVAVGCGLRPRRHSLVGLVRLVLVAVAEVVRGWGSVVRFERSGCVEDMRFPRKQRQWILLSCVRTVPIAYTPL